MNAFSQCSIMLMLGAVLVIPVIAGPRAKGPVSKIYVAEAQGETIIQSGEKVFNARQAIAFDAPGTVIETGENARNAFVYSNGTGMYVDRGSRVEINRFVQEPFRSDRMDMETEPSISQSSVHIPRGFVSVCTSNLVAGTAMTYSTPLAFINIRGGKVAIQSSPNETVVYLLEGDVTVRAGEQDPGGIVLRPGERMVIRRGLPGQPPAITVGPIVRPMMQTLIDRSTIADNARKTVTFEVIERIARKGVDNPAGEPPVSDLHGEQPSTANIASSGAALLGAAEVSATEVDAVQEIVARPTVPAQLPTNLVVSLASLIPAGR
ncbi:MAG: hypothetical protein PHQ04_09890 [Opitutaceae bacterium]|nr:hypothetical protein [Opitutaceae bacterium]